MAYKIVKTNSYQRDLDSAVGYIVLSLVNKTAAVSLKVVTILRFFHAGRTMKN